jgi:hypothetical protein
MVLNVVVVGLVGFLAWRNEQKNAYVSSATHS